MKTDDLIRALAADTLRPAAPGPALLLPLLVPALGVALVAMWLTIGFRTDLADVPASPLSFARIVLTALLGAIAVRLALLLARPEGAGVARLWPLAAVAAVAAAMWVWALVATPAEGRGMAIVGKTMVSCLVTIPLLSVLPVASILYVLRQGATTAPARAGFVAGLAGAGLSAMIYALHCTEDSPLFYVTWYGIAIMGVALVSAAIGARSLRW
jgi:hypothetical protein